jgi:hypothetical protein
MTASTDSPAARLLAAMAATPNSTQAALALAAGCARSTASVALAKLVADGEAVRTEALGKGAATYRVGTSVDSVLDQLAGVGRPSREVEAELDAAAEARNVAAAHQDGDHDGADDEGHSNFNADCPLCTTAYGSGGFEGMAGDPTAQNPEVPAGGAAIPTAADMTAGLTRGTWKQLGAVLGDEVEVLTPNHERLAGELATSGGVCFLVTEGGRRQVSLGGWATKQYGRVLQSARASERPGPRAEAKAKAAVAKKAAEAPAEAPAEKVDRRKGDRSHYVPRGGLKAMVWAWYAANPGVAMTPHKMAKAIGAKAPGAVLDQQRNAVKAGYAVQHEAPLRFEWKAGVECPQEQATMAADLGFVPERLES